MLPRQWLLEFLSWGQFAAVIARSAATKQSSVTSEELDCFVARAHLNDENRYSTA